MGHDGVLGAVQLRFTDARHTAVDELPSGAWSPDCGQGSDLIVHTHPPNLAVLFTSLLKLLALRIESVGCCQVHAASLLREDFVLLVVELAPLALIQDFVPQACVVHGFASFIGHDTTEVGLFVEAFRHSQRMVGNTPHIKPTPLPTSHSDMSVVAHQNPPVRQSSAR